MKKSILVKTQTREYRADWNENGVNYAIVAKVRHDDCCGNGHNSFAVTADVYASDNKARRDGYLKGVGGWIMGGCCHDEIKKHLPALAPFIKWHLSDTESGHIHYKANALYYAGHCKAFSEPGNYPANWAAFASHVVLGAVASDPATTAPLEKMTARELAAWLDNRQPALLDAFQRDVEALGLVF